jgi:Tellurite resistance protein
MKTISPQAALVYVMVVVSASDGAMHDKELAAIAELTSSLPVFAGFDQDRLRATVEDCTAILQENEGLQAVLGLVNEALSPSLRETAYWVGLEMALCDREIALEEIRVIDVIRRTLGIDKLVAAALERGARARYQVA